MKLLLIPENRKQLETVISLIDGCLLGVQGLSVNVRYTVLQKDLEEVISYVQSQGKEVFIALNKNMHNKDLPYLKEIMQWLEGKNIQGIFYYDVALVTIKQKNHFKTPLVWSQEHLTTNATTTNFWYEEGVLYTYLSAEITKDEILAIEKSSKSKLIVPLFGYLPMFVSKRHLVKNYLDRFSIVDNSKVFFMEKEGKEYPVIDNEEGTVVYSAMILNGLSAYFSMQDNTIEYGTLNGFLIEDEKLKKGIECFREVNRDNVKEKEAEIDSLFSNVDRGFLYKETIYKVKKNG